MSEGSAYASWGLDHLKSSPQANVGIGGCESPQPSCETPALVAGVFVLRATGSIPARSPRTSIFNWPASAVGIISFVRGSRSSPPSADHLGIISSSRSRWRRLRFSQVPLFLAAEQPMRADIMAFSSQHAHFINPENKYFGRRRSRKLFCTSRLSSPRFVLMATCRAKTFRWTETSDDISASIQRFCLRTLAANA
jgi:hypothetical protein